MQTSSVSRWLARSPLARAVAFPIRAVGVMRYDARLVGRSVRWLFTSREHHNFTYDLTDRNRAHLAWFLATAMEPSVEQFKGWLDEVEHDTELRELLAKGVATSDRRGLADEDVHYGRRIAWYACVRALKPKHVVETGVDKGLGSCLIAAALRRNAAEGHSGRLSALDINPDAGYLVQGAYREYVDIVCGDSLKTIPALDTAVDLFIHDSWHSVEHEAAEFALVEEKLSANAVLLSDNSAETDVLLELAERTGRQFLYFQEMPSQHWFPGDGTGIAWFARSAEASPDADARNGAVASAAEGTEIDLVAR